MRRALFIGIGVLLASCGGGTKSQRVHDPESTSSSKGSKFGSAVDERAPGLALRSFDAKDDGGHTLRSIADEARAFFGASYPPAEPPAPHGVVGSLTWGTWIQPAPRSGALPLGGIREGGWLPLSSAAREPGQGKCREFVRVALPDGAGEANTGQGYVCVGPRSSLDREHPFLRAGRWTTPAPGVMPYLYAFSVGAPMLTRPLPAEKMMSWRIGNRDQPPLKGWDAGHDELAEMTPLEESGPMPEFLAHDGRAPTPWGPAQGDYKRMLPKGTLVAFTRVFEAQGRKWALLTDLSVVPAEGLKPFRVSSFHGVELGAHVKLPLAFMRKTDRPKWRRVDAGGGASSGGSSGTSRFEPTGERWPAKSFVQLTGVEVKDGKRRFLETREPGVYIERSDATRVEPVEKAPWEAKGGKWIHVRVNRGTLTLYEGTTPVFTTLMSPGKEDSTPYGRYFIESKHHFTTMSGESGAPKNGWIADVPWTLYFKRPYAIHAAYWHEDFGQRKSAGCVNLSPLDAKRVFDWASPALPAGWNTVQGYGMGGGTFVLVEG